MMLRISNELRAKFKPSTNVGVVILEAARILCRCTFNEVRSKFPEIEFEVEMEGGKFDCQIHATVWDLRLGELMADENREEFRKAEERIQLAKEEEVLKEIVTAEKKEP